MPNICIERGHTESELTWVHCAFEDDMDLLIATEGTTSFTVFSQAMGAEERAVLFFQKNVIYSRTDT